MRGDPLIAEAKQSAQQRPALRCAHDGHAGDLVMPGLAVVVEEHPENTEAADDERDDANSANFTAKEKLVTGKGPRVALLLPATLNKTFPT